ncbi:MAG: hypothetical protein NT010_00310 [Proteobacteria bacterium]|nr:hypothetical protein [Pseudomonadota bacterium]
MKPSVFVQTIICIFVFWATCMPLDKNSEWLYIDEGMIRIVNRELVQDRLVSVDTVVAYQETRSGNPSLRPIRIDLSRIAPHQLVFPNKRKLCEGDYLRVGKEKLEVTKIGKNIPLFK